MSANITAIAYLVSAVLFILSLRGLSSPETARRGNVLGMVGMGVAIATTLGMAESISPSTWAMIAAGILLGGGIGAYLAHRIAMTAMPQLVAVFNSLVGLAAVCVAAAAFYAPAAYGIGTWGAIKTVSLIEMSLGTFIGAITFTGSLVAFAKLQGLVSGRPIVFRGQHLLNAGLGLGMVGLIAWFTISQSGIAFWGVVGLAFVLGVLIIVPIGGADMPVVVSMLNSYSGWAAVGVGFTLGNMALIVTGALVGASGAILSYIMCKAMNRSFFSVVLGGFGAEASSDSGSMDAEERQVKRGSADDATFFLKNARSVIIVPGYGMAVAKAQHALKEMADQLKEANVKVSYAIHPVAGRMPGHMNVLLAEAKVPYDEIFELDDINSQFPQADVAFVIGANDVTNPAAKSDPGSPIFGMPVLDVERAKSVLFIKRGLGSGYSGIQNELFFKDNTMMLFGDAKKTVEQIVKAA